MPKNQRGQRASFFYSLFFQRNLNDLHLYEEILLHFTNISPRSYREDKEKINRYFEENKNKSFLYIDEIHYGEILFSIYYIFDIPMVKAVKALKALH